MATEEKEDSMNLSFRQDLDNSTSLEIDQSTESLPSQKNSEVRVSFMGESKKLLTSFWGKITGFERVLHEKCIQFFQRKKIE